MVQKTVGFGYSLQKKKKGWKWFLVLLIAILVLAIRWWIKYSPSDLVFENQKVSIVKWDTISKFYDTLLDDNQTFWMKWYVRNHEDQLPKIQEWTYIFSGKYTNEEFLSHIAQGPEKEYISYTILEWRSIYDIDADLAAKWYINEWEYISYVTDPAKISELSTRYDFFDSSLTSLEWFLYPDTYFLDNRWNLVNQLVSIQLNAFKSKNCDFFMPYLASISATSICSIFVNPFSIRHICVLSSTICSISRSDDMIYVSYSHFPSASTVSSACRLNVPIMSSASYPASSMRLIP